MTDAKEPLPREAVALYPEYDGPNPSDDPVGFVRSIHGYGRKTEEQIELLVRAVFHLRLDLVDLFKPESKQDSITANTSPELKAHVREVAEVLGVSPSEFTRLALLQTCDALAEQFDAVPARPESAF